MKTIRNARRFPSFPRRPGVVAATLILVLAASGCVSSRAYRDGEREEARKHWDLAVLAYEKALALDPNYSAARISLERARFQAAQAHYARGRLHRSAGQLDLAVSELEVALALDPTNDSAQQELRRAKEDVEKRNRENAGGTPVEKAKAASRGMRAAPPMLNPSSTKPIDVAFAPDTEIKKIYAALGAAAGINIIYDPQLKNDRFTLDLRGMTFQKALETAMRQAGHFYKVIDEKTILIAQDTQQNRKEYEDLVVRTFFLSNGDVKDVSAMVRSILDLRRLGTIPALNAIVIRDTADKVAVAERLIEENDKAKSEVVVDVELLQVNTGKLLDLGTILSARSVTASVVPRGTTSVAATLPWHQITDLGTNDFMFTIPTITFNFIKDNTDAELLAKPQLRIAEGEKAQLVIGDRVPIPVTTINTQQAVGSTGVVPITSFQYQDVGIKIDMEPRVHHNKEVSLKLTIEVSQISRYVTAPDGTTQQPVIGTRTITSSIRLKDGETNFLAGLIRKDSSRTKETIPFLGDIPILGKLLTHANTKEDRTDLYLTLTPHIIRSPQITEEDLIPIWVGTENNVSFSGLNTALVSPNAPGSPFDAAHAPGRPPARPAGTPPAVNPILPIIQGTPPNDPFRRTPTPAPSTPRTSNETAAPEPQAQASTTGAASASARALQASAGSPGEGTAPAPSALVANSNPAPAPTPKPAVDSGVAPAPQASGAGSGAGTAPGPQALVAGAATSNAVAGPGIVASPASPMLRLAATSPEIAPGEVSVVNVTGDSGLEALGSLEVTIEWDPAVAEVTGVAPGPWRNAQGAETIRFDADRVAGRARLHFTRAAGPAGLPSGVLAKLAMRALAPGTTLVRVTAGSASTPGGAAPALRVEAASLKVKSAS
ncbi:MAG: secretin N-terminal domain-containing protein [Acidobacteriota bacterium]